MGDPLVEGARRRWGVLHVHHESEELRVALSLICSPRGASPEDLEPLLRLVRAIVFSNAVHRATMKRAKWVAGTARDPHHKLTPEEPGALRPLMDIVERVISDLERLSQNSIRRSCCTSVMRSASAGGFASPGWTRPFARPSKRPGRSSCGCARPARHRVWEVLCRDLFQRYVGEGATVLDLSCGFGEFTRFIRAQRKIAVDLNLDAGAGLPPEVEFHLADARALDFLPDGNIDVCFTSNFFEHLGPKQELELVLREVFRVLRPGGRLVALHPNIKYAPGDYWDFYDNDVLLSHASFSEALRARKTP